MKKAVFRRLRRRLLALLAVFVLLIVVLDIRLRPLIREYAVAQAQVRLSEAMCDAVETALGQADEPLMTVVRDEAGAVLSAETDAAAVNRLNAAIGTGLNDLLSERDRALLKLPIGSILGGSFLMGRGPAVTVRIDRCGAVTSELNSVFEAAGINQTVHRVELTLTVRATVLAAGMSDPIETSGTFLVSETVIVGGVPDTYAQITR